MYKEEEEEEAKIFLRKPRRKQRNGAPRAVEIYSFAKREQLENSDESFFFSPRVS